VESLAQCGDVLRRRRIVRGARLRPRLLRERSFPGPLIGVRSEIRPADPRGRRSGCARWVLRRRRARGGEGRTPELNEGEETEDEGPRQINLPGSRSRGVGSVRDDGRAGDVALVLLGEGFVDLLERELV